ncbi:MAG TPA: hypothetical protein VH297_00880 [Gaiellaceae bacterium]
MVFLLILLAFLGFTVFGTSSGSSTGVGDVMPPVKCSQHMVVGTNQARQNRCGPPPANP